LKLVKFVGKDENRKEPPVDKRYIEFLKPSEIVNAEAGQMA
jgi:hypothetical protein